MPTSSLLDQVRKFLPALADANSHLEAEMAVRPQKDFDIENVSDAGPVVQMDIACGLFDVSNEHDAEAAGLLLSCSPLVHLREQLNQDDGSDTSSSDISACIEDQGQVSGVDDDSATEHGKSVKLVPIDNLSAFAREQGPTGGSPVMECVSGTGGHRLKKPGNEAAAPSAARQFTRERRLVEELS